MHKRKYNERQKNEDELEALLQKIALKNLQKQYDLHSGLETNTNDVQRQEDERGTEFEPLSDKQLKEIDEEQRKELEKIKIEQNKREEAELQRNLKKRENKKRYQEERKKDRELKKQKRPVPVNDVNKKLD